MHKVMPLPSRSHKASRTRFCPDRDLPAYAYLPGGRYPHPVRHPQGHSFGAEQEPQPFYETSTPQSYFWGVDLFNHHFYWEAHEAWEPLWQGAEPQSPKRHLLKALILLAAGGVKVREGKRVAERRHLERAAALLDTLDPAQFSAAVGMTPKALAEQARAEAAHHHPHRRRSGLAIWLDPSQ